LGVIGKTEKTTSYSDRSWPIISAIAAFTLGIRVKIASGAGAKEDNLLEMQAKLLAYLLQKISRMGSSSRVVINTIIPANRRGVKLEQTWLYRAILGPLP
jgi:hypothetical protein